MIDSKNFWFMGYNFYACDTGITADSAKELFDKCLWCRNNGIYMGRIPLQGYTIAEVIFLHV